jgi:hypothetical protein
MSEPTESEILALLVEALPTDEELRLLKRDVHCAIESFEYPKGTRDADQPTEWHQAKMLERFVRRLERARRAFQRGRRVRGA